MKFIYFVVACSVLLLSSFAHAKVDTAELQFSLCETNPQHVVERLGASMLDGRGKKEMREVYYLETLTRDLQRRGAVMRFRETEKGIKSSAKFAYQYNEQIPDDEFDELDVNCEVDAYLSRAKIGCSVKHDPSELGKVSREQKKFFKKNGIDPQIWDETRLWGPVTDLDWSIEISGYLFSLDTFYLPTGQVFMELSVRVSLVDALQMQQQILARINAAQLQLCESQSGVTKKILDHYLGSADDLSQ